MLTGQRGTEGRPEEPLVGLSPPKGPGHHLAATSPLRPAMPGEVEVHGRWPVAVSHCWGLCTAGPSETSDLLSL